MFLSRLKPTVQPVCTRVCFIASSPTTASFPPCASPPNNASRPQAWMLVMRGWCMARQLSTTTIGPHAATQQQHHNSYVTCSTATIWTHAASVTASPFLLKVYRLGRCLDDAGGSGGAWQGQLCAPATSHAASRKALSLQGCMPCPPRCWGGRRCWEGAARGSSHTACSERQHARSVGREPRPWRVSWLHS
eukprot:scaffold234402_cov23-Tisochrysis_lutea.AAC.1